MNDIRESMRRWAIWRCYRKRNPWPHTTVLGKVLDGMPTTKCPHCRTTGRYGGDVCPCCNGEGRIKSAGTPSQVNPAFIKSTFRQPDDPTSERIDALMCELRLAVKTQGYYFVLWEEFVSALGTQDVKAARLGITHAYYRRLLCDGLKVIQTGLFESQTETRAIAIP